MREIEEGGEFDDHWRSKRGDCESNEIIFQKISVKITLVYGIRIPLPHTVTRFNGGTPMRLREWW